MSSTTPAVRRKRPAKPQFTQTILVLEAFVVLFATLAVHGLRVYPTGPVWLVGGVLLVLLLVASGWVGRPGGYVVGWVLQGWLVAPAGPRARTSVSGRRTRTRTSSTLPTHDRRRIPAGPRPRPRGRSGAGLADCPGGDPSG